MKTKSFSEPECLVCAYSEPATKGHRQCRRHAPVLVAGDRQKVLWPVVKNEDWCGDFKPT